MTGFLGGEILGWDVFRHDRRGYGPVSVGGCSWISGWGDLGWGAWVGSFGIGQVVSAVDQFLVQTMISH